MIGYLNGFGVVDSPNALRIDEIDADTTYKGIAACGVLNSESKWSICKISKSGTVTSITWADGDELPNNIWDNRASITYI